jgi:hypothetical protein
LVKGYWSRVFYLNPSLNSIFFRGLGIREENMGGHGNNTRGGLILTTAEALAGAYQPTSQQALQNVNFPEDAT